MPAPLNKFLNYTGPLSKYMANKLMEKAKEEEMKKEIVKRRLPKLEMLKEHTERMEKKITVIEYLLNNN